MDLELGDEQEFEIKDNVTNELDTIAGYLQDILISEDFEQISNDFLRDNCKIFDSIGENKREYMVIFKQYQKQIEEFIEQKLKEQGFETHDIFNNLKNIPLDDYIMETLYSIIDYELFKDIMIETKIRVEEEERTIKKTINKAAKGYKQVSNNNIFSAQPQQQPFDVKQLKSQKQQSNGDLRPDLFFNVIPLSTPKITRKQ